jgi:hemerythrin
MAQQKLCLELQPMHTFEWTSSLNTGVAMIDPQHKELIVAINDLAEAIEQDRGKTAIKKLLVFMK